MGMKVPGVGPLTSILSPTRGEEFFCVSSPLWGEGWVRGLT